MNKASFSGKGAFVMVAAAVLMLLVLSSWRLCQALSSRVCLWLGRISYSLYLVHVPILFLLADLLHDYMSFALIDLLGILLSLALATFMYVVVELPAINFGKVLARRL